jgi:hypothetical protein
MGTRIRERDGERIFKEAASYLHKAVAVSMQNPPSRRPNGAAGRGLSRAPCGDDVSLGLSSEVDSVCQRLALRHPAASASASVQNHRSPRPFAILICA